MIGHEGLTARYAAAAATWHDARHKDNYAIMTTNLVNYDGSRVHMEPLNGAAASTPPALISDKGRPRGAGGRARRQVMIAYLIDKRRKKDGPFCNG